MVQKEISKTPFSIYWWFFQVIVVLGLASVVVWLSLIPKNPVFTVADIYIPALNTSNSTVQQHELNRNTSLIFTLQISNPNKGMGIFYDDILITLFHVDDTIGTKTIPGFYQGHKKNLLLDVLINGDTVFWRGIADRVFGLRLFVETKVKYKVFRWKTKHHWMVCEASAMIDPQGRIYGEKNIRLHHTLKMA
ncbi:protein NDR1-like [Camellia sinensis]|uniref:Late embryogenesis abundant protein LEA-2 subgroup domain-containing protein n=1 Tax=Camellia sinensis var. sinensis TaxID=542762 RepID=A0A4S4D3B1_CAMSN|nr:protein NDR1-like [Camellia sinensis]THF96772.1 hypothetical protein TEA_016381 [Camellia sinensis var. sinensis]